MKNEKKLPFGITIATKIVLQAISEAKAPLSIVLQNLFALQKSTEFPEHLDAHWFSARPLAPANHDVQNKIRFLMEEFKKPNVSKEQLIEKFLVDGWENKKPSKKTVDMKKPALKTPFAAKKTIKKKIVKPATVPVVIVKKAKM